MTKSEKSQSDSPNNKKAEGERETKHIDILFYLPNIVGYLRFIFNFISVRYAFDPSDESWIRFIVFYSISQMLDAIDGALARKFN